MSTDQNFPSEKVVSELVAPQGVRPLNQRGRVERREVLRAGAAGIIGTIFGGKSANATGLFSGLMGDSASAAEANAP
ncbi:MAG: hypothetical protein CTY30_10485, partial [Methylocystis sp.]